MSVAERTLSDPSAIEGRLEEIDQELATKANDVELAAAVWFRKKREREREHAKAMLLSTRERVAEREAEADEKTAEIGADAEGQFEALRLSLKALEARANIGMSMLRHQTRAGG